MDKFTLVDYIREKRPEIIILDQDSFRELRASCDSYLIQYCRCTGIRIENTIIRAHNHSYFHKSYAVLLDHMGEPIIELINQG